MFGYFSEITRGVSIIEGFPDFYDPDSPLPQVNSAEDDRKFRCVPCAFEFGARA